MQHRRRAGIAGARAAEPRRDDLRAGALRDPARHATPSPSGASEISGDELAVTVRQDLLDHLTGEAGPYNATFTQNGIASTTATIIAASLGFTSIDKLTDDQIEQIKQAHLLLAMFNALQPGVFALSGWDLVGVADAGPQAGRAGCSPTATPAGSTGPRTT